MKLTSTILALAPAALAKVARNKHAEVKRDPSFDLSGGFGGVGGVGGVGVAAVGLSPIVGVVPLVGVSPVILLYTNQGGGSQNQVINSQVTVTQTVQVPAGGQATAIAGVDGVTQTVQPGGTGTMVMSAATHVVTVGGDLGRAFFPADIAANPGDTILFNFMAQNHSVTQSGFDTPCVPLEGGMDSGFMANADNSIDPPPQVAMQVTTTEPLWMYCAQGDHCSVGMVLSINANLEKTHAQFQANAIATGSQPGTAITGGAPGGAPAGAAPAGNDTAVDPNLATPPQSLPDPANIVNDPLNQPSIANSPSTGSIATGALNGGLVMGLGTVNADGSCNCAIQCDNGGSAAVAAAGVPADVGLGGFGGQVAVIPMGAAGVGAQSVGGSVGVASVAPLGGLSVDPLSAASSVDPLAAATVDPLAAATVDPAAAGSTGLVAPDPAIVGR